MSTSLHEALFHVQCDMEEIAKDKKAYNYKYADLSAIAKKLKEPFKKHGLFWTTAFDDGWLSVSIVHIKTGESTSSRLPVPEFGNPQDFGKWITYMRRYLLSGLLGIVPDEDTDAADVTYEAKRAAPAPKPPREERLKKYVNGNGAAQDESEPTPVQEARDWIERAHKAGDIGKLEELEKRVHESSKIAARFKPVLKSLCVDKRNELIKES